ncbi:uncharacterized protein [Pyrus communis]|uniref:uncharacterized protein n=1 Tax=Pyrus communis TaxID=23211 RepID=UPI0035BF8793
MEEYSVDDPTQLLEAASDFASYPGFQNDASAKEFLDCFPLPVILNALQTKVDVPGLESTLVAVLERVFKTKYGASLIPQFVPFIQVGVMAESQEVKSLACKTVSCLLENLNEGSVSATHLILDRIIYPLLFDCLIHQILNLKTVLSTIERILSSSETQEIDECESALEALGQIGSSSPFTFKFLLQWFLMKRQAALHALGNISGEIRSANSMILTSDAEESLRRLIYETASKSSKLTPSGLFLSVLKQDSEIRLAGYRMLSGLVARPWCLMEICSKQEIINIVTHPITETTKLAMEARYNCCKAIHTVYF